MRASRSVRWWLPALALGLAATTWGQLAPSPITGEMPANGFSAAGKLSNLAVVSFSSSSVYDDNFSNGASQHQGGGQQYLAATFGWQQTRRRLQWNLSYRPGVVLESHSQVGNQFNQVFGTTLEVEPTVRWSLKLRQDYALTTDPFERLGEAPLQPGLSPLDRPNQLAVLPQVRRTASFTGAGASYRLSRHTTAGLNGSYTLQQYSEDGSTWAVPLIDNRAVSGNTYLSRQISRSYTAGVEYRARYLTFPGYDLRTLTHSVLSFHQFAVTANSTVVIYGGPEYARTRGQTFAVRNAAVFPASWSPAAGAIYSWSGRRNRLQAGLSRQVSDGGGVQGPVRLSAAWLRLGRQLGRRWTAEANSELAQQTALPAELADHLRLLRAGAGFHRELSREASVRLSYDRLYQTGGSLFYRPGNHNRVMLSVEHRFMRPLGRSQ